MVVHLPARLPLSARLALAAVMLAALSMGWLGYAHAQTPDEAPLRLLPAQGSKDGTTFASGIVLVRVRESSQRASTVAQMLGVDESALAPLSISGQPGLYRVTVPAGAEEDEAARLSGLPATLYAEPDYLFYATETVPNDTFYRRYQWNLRQIRAHIGWDRTRGDSGIIIAVVDTGVDLGHPDLAGKIVPGIDTINNDSIPEDDQGHGTHVASIAAAISNNGMGVAGLDWNARVMPVKALNSRSVGTSSSIAAGIIWAVDNGAHIINLSLAGTSPATLIENAINYAHERGVLIIAAAGNAYNLGNPTNYPAAYDHVLAVAALDDVDGHASYSSSGPYIDVAAPGGDPISLEDEDPRHWISGAYWRGAGFAYALLSGTSQAAPQVAGLAGLLLALDGTLTADDLTQIITESAVDVQAKGWDPFSGHGRIDVVAALAAATPNPGVPGLVVATDLYQPGTETPGVVALGDEITFTIRMTNTGSSGLSIVPVQDVFDPTYLSFVRADPKPDQMTENTLQWSNPINNGSLAPGLTRTLTVTFQTRKNTDDQIRRETQNVLVVLPGQDVFAQQTPIQADAAQVRIARSAVKIRKTILAPIPAEVGAGAELVFGIRVENVGQETLTQIPVYDIYEADALAFLQSDIGRPRVTISGTRGELYWPDITDYAGDLQPGQAFSFTATFRMTAARTTTNRVRVGYVLDAFSDPVPQFQGAGSVDAVPVKASLFRLFVPAVRGLPVELPCALPGCPIPGLRDPNSMAVHTGYNRLYINSRDTNQLIVVNGASLAPIKTVETGQSPWGIAINPQTNRVYVSNFAGRDIWVYDALTLDLLAKIPVGGNPGLMAILPGLDTVAVAVHGLNGVAIVRGLSLEQIASSGGAGPYGVAADPLSQDFLLINRDAGTGRILIRREGAWRAEGAELSFGKSGDRLVPFGAAFNPANRKLYVSYMQANGLWYVDVFHKESSREVMKLETVRVGSSGSDRDPNVGGVGLAVNPRTNNLFLADTQDGTISIISGTTNRLAATIPTGAYPYAVAVNPATNQVFVNLRGNHSIHKFADAY